MRVDIQSVVNNLSELQTRIPVAANLYGQTAAAQLEADAKQNAPWTDRTGNSRQTIQGDSQLMGHIIRISISGFTPQFKFLEKKKKKKWAILNPTIMKNASKIAEGFKKIIG